jgi:predicted nuclease of predicted toxin-antitoxin system
VKFLFDHDVPDDLAFCLEALGNEVVKLRQLRPTTIADDEVLRLATEQQCLLITCNRDDFLTAAQRVVHSGIIILIRRKSRAAERAALLRLLDTAGEQGLRGNINFA